MAELPTAAALRLVGTAAAAAAEARADAEAGAADAEKRARAQGSALMRLVGDRAARRAARAGRLRGRAAALGGELRSASEGVAEAGGRARAGARRAAEALQGVADAFGRFLAGASRCATQFGGAQFQGECSHATAAMDAARAARRWADGAEATAKEAAAEEGAAAASPPDVRTVSAARVAVLGLAAVGATTMDFVPLAEAFRADNRELAESLAGDDASVAAEARAKGACDEAERAEGACAEELARVSEQRARIAALLLTLATPLKGALREVGRGATAAPSAMAVTTETRVRAAMGAARAAERAADEAARRCRESGERTADCRALATDFIATDANATVAAAGALNKALLAAEFGFDAVATAARESAAFVELAASAAEERAEQLGRPAIVENDCSTMDGALFEVVTLEPLMPALPMQSGGVFAPAYAMMADPCQPMSTALPNFMRDVLRAESDRPPSPRSVLVPEDAPPNDAKVLMALIAKAEDETRKEQERLVAATRSAEHATALCEAAKAEEEALTKAENVLGDALERAKTSAVDASAQLSRESDALGALRGILESTCDVLASPGPDAPAGWVDAKDDAAERASAAGQARDGVGRRNDGLISWARAAGGLAERCRNASPKRLAEAERATEDLQRVAKEMAAEAERFAKLLPTGEVYDEVARKKVLFSFGSRFGGLDLAVSLRAALVERGGQDAAYVDLVDLRAHKDTTVTPVTLPSGKRIDKVLNPHWAEFYYMSVLLCETVVLILDKAWTDSAYCAGEWQLMLRAINKTYGQSAPAYDLHVVIIYSGGWGEREDAVRKARELGVTGVAAAVPAVIDGEQSRLLDDKAKGAFFEAVDAGSRRAAAMVAAQGDLPDHMRKAAMMLEYERNWRALAVKALGGEQWWNRAGGEGSIEHPAAEYPDEWAVFVRVDANRDGKLDKGEVMATLEAIGEVSLAKGLIEHLDVDRDGLVSFNEFVRGYGRWREATTVTRGTA